MTRSLGTCRIGRGSAWGSPCRTASTSITRPVGETATNTATPSTACAQQPQVTQVGGQAESLCPGGSLPVHGSAIIRLERPDALRVSVATMNARTSRRT